MEPVVMMKRGSMLPASVVEEILASAAAASAEAPNRALKRRVRQRLHKKLGSMLTSEEFEKAIDRYQVLEEEQSKEASGAAFTDHSAVASKAPNGPQEGLEGTSQTTESAIDDDDLESISELSTEPGP
ncbi:SCN10A [Symbiodinium sp. CCMP2592]|nr:SCN10A [Symbiodinium sp. CCMP2592]